MLLTTDTKIVDGIQLADGDNHLYVKFTDSNGLIQTEEQQSGESENGIHLSLLRISASGTRPPKD